MKLKSILITIAFALSCGGLQAQNPTGSPRAEILNSQQSFTELAGRQVWNYQNQLLGRIKFITADVENARHVEVVIASGGFFGLGGKLTSVPPRAFKLDETQQVMRLDVTKERFDAAPRYKTSNIALYSQPDRVAAIHRYYGQDPWFYHEGHSVSKNAQVLRLGHVDRTDHILGMSIKSPTGKYLGQVSSLMMDVPTGQINQVVDETQSMAGNGRFLIQPRALRYNAAHNGFVLNESLAALKNGPHLKWVDQSREYFQKESSGNRNVQPVQVRRSKKSAQ
jgi:hypothetical protein